MGPLEYVVITFEGNHFTGEILPELRALRNQDVVRVVDLLFFQKDAQGRLTAREFSDLTEEEAMPYGPIAGDMLDVFSDTDVEAAASDLPNNSAGAILLLEHTWALRLREKILKAHGTVISAGLVPQTEVEDLAAAWAATETTTGH
jgi:uncharacterized membrane protein